MEKFVIIDGNSLINRAFYGLPMLRSLSGKPCNAVYGFINMMLNIITKHRPKYFVVVFDAGKHTFRHNMYAEYKGGRDKMPEDLAEQLPMLKEVLVSMGIKILEKPEIEADDIIGTLTRKFDEEFILVSGDKDLLQLINSNTTVWLTQKGISSVKEVDIPMLKSEFGLEPYQVIELKALMGDSSDNIPGVPGVGKVTADKLISDYANVDNIYAHINEIKGSLKTKLENNKELCYLSKQLATIKLDVELDCTLEDCEYRLPFGQTTYELLRELDFRSILNRKELFSYEKKQEVVAVNLNPEIVEIESGVDFADMVSKIGNSFSICSQDLCFSFGVGDTEYILYKNGETFNNSLLEFKDIMEDNTKQKVCFDCKELMHEMDNYNISINNYFDASIAIYVANEMDAEISLMDALKLNEITTEAYAQAILKLKELYMSKLINNLGLKLYSQIELPLVEVLYDMEKTGIAVDVEQIKSLSRSYHDELNQVQNKIWDLVGIEFNINSPKQLQEILFDKLNLSYKGKKSTSIDVLNAIADQHEAVGLIIRYRKINKMISTYLDGMLQCVNGNKIHTTFMQRTTSTGRLSSREPNLQNLPIRDDEGKALRKMFKSSFDGGTLVSADYNQIELRLIANFSGDENMIADYLSGKDIHTATASKIFNVDTDAVTSQMRRTAKAVNFGIIYGISAYGLSQNIGTSPKEAGAFIDKYLSIYPKVKEYGEKCITEAREQGYATTMMGRIRHIKDINSSNHVMRGFAERTAKNMPLQGSASDIIKIAMIRVYNKLKELDLKSKLILQIHDELIIDCYPGESEIVGKILKEEMESVVDLKVPLIVEVSEGVTLYDAK